MDPAGFDLTDQIATDYEIIKNAATERRLHDRLAEAAVAELEEEGVDVNGEDFEKPEVEVTPGGE